MSLDDLYRLARLVGALAALGLLVYIGGQVLDVAKANIRTAV